MGRNICFTLGFNLTTEIEETTRLLYEQNPDGNFEHYIVDLGFPLEFGNDIPENIVETKKLNTQILKDICAEYGSRYVQLPNVGVSQNWTAFMKYVDLQDNDILICAEPDERVLNDGWVKAVTDVLRARKDIAICSLMLMEHVNLMGSIPHEFIEIEGRKTYVMPSAHNIAQCGFSGAFLNKIGGMPVPNGAPIYGWIEHALYPLLAEHGYKMSILHEYLVSHTENVPLYRAWKTEITSNVAKGQMSFETYLKSLK